MMATKISTAEVKQLREATGAGVMASKRALEAAGGDMDKAKEILRASGLASAASKQHRETPEGLVEAYIHPSRPLGALVALGCETDFVARTEGFKTLARELAMHIAAMNPGRVSEEDQGDGETLLGQAYFRDQSKSVRDVISELIAKTGENIRVVGFSRFELGS